MVVSMYGIRNVGSWVWFSLYTVPNVAVMNGIRNKYMRFSYKFCNIFGFICYHLFCFCNV